jgi:hypothetical protein
VETISCVRWRTRTIRLSGTRTCTQLHHVQSSPTIFFIIDGLDEFEGGPEAIIQLVRGITQPNVKLCIASRPWLSFQDSFKKQPTLCLEHQTKSDISTYVNDHFRNNEHYIRLIDHDPLAGKILLHEVVNKASGVFLWVYLVTQSLLEGLSNEDTMSDLQVRLDSLPSDLEALFDVILTAYRRSISDTLANCFA